MGRKDDLDNHSRQMNPENDAYWELNRPGFCGGPLG